MATVFNRQNARREAQEAVNDLYNAVIVTQGPLGGDVMIKENGVTRMTHDGVSVAKAFQYPKTEEFAFKQMVVDHVRDIAKKLEREAGDGTTTVIGLTKSLLDELNEQ